jgi:hypothetical protein
MTEDAGKARQLRKQERKRNLLSALFVVVALVFLVLTFWQQATGSIPHIEIPNPPMPWRNAHDTYVAASKAIVDGKKIDIAVSKRHSGKDDDVPYTLAQKEQLVAENAAVIHKLRASFSDPYLAPPARSFAALFPYYADFRKMARLLSLEQQVEIGHGNWNAAANTGMDAMNMGAQMTHGAIMIGSLVGIACQSIGRRSTWDAIDHLNAAQARKAAARMEQILGSQASYDSMVQEEEWMGQAGLIEVFRKAKGRGMNDLLRSSFGVEPGQGSGQFMTALRMTMVGPRGVILNYTHYMDALRARDSKRYGDRGPVPPVPDDPINQMLAPSFSQADFMDAQTRAQNALLAVSFALRAYFLEHNDYPLTLDELQQDGYLKKIPLDPFGSTGKLVYRRTKPKYVLYSVGPDGKDDGGKPIDDPREATASGGEYARHTPRIDSQGDIVAGVNR